MITQVSLYQSDGQCKNPGKYNTNVALEAELDSKHYAGRHTNSVRT